VTVPQGAAAPTFHITGKVVYGGAPIAGYLVQLDSDDMAFGPYFVNRVTTGADGTFDLQAPAGSFRIQAQHPTYLTLNDVERDPLALQALRRSITTPFVVGGPVALLDAEMEYADYDKLSPVATATLPTTFAITLLPGAENARVAVYGTAGGTGTTVGTQWYWSPQDTSTSVVFDGAFNQPSALEPSVVPGEQYFWGTYQYRPAGDGLSWRGQSMVLPIVWN
jgi:hypothetical protein